MGVQMQIRGTKDGIVLHRKTDGERERCYSLTRWRGISEKNWVLVERGQEDSFSQGMKEERC